MATNVHKLGIRVLAGTAVAAGPVAAACSFEPTYDEWAATDGAAGRINLDEVQQAFKGSKSATDFEQRVNQIYEGDGLVLIRAKQDGQTLVLEGWEDLNGSFEIDDTADDLLFTVVNKDDSNELRGHGSNGYYNSGFGGGGFLMGYMFASAFSPRYAPIGYHYGTSPSHARTNVTRQRNSYRSSPRYRSQVSRNSKYFSGQKKSAGAKYNSAGRNQSTARQGYKSTQRTTGKFKTSGTGVRSSWGSSRGGSRGARGGGRSGFRGFGGGQRIIGPIST